MHELFSISDTYLSVMVYIGKKGKAYSGAMWLIRLALNSGFHSVKGLRVFLLQPEWDAGPLQG